MRVVTATELARNLKKILDRVQFAAENVTIVRNKQPIAFLMPGSSQMTALEAMSDLYRTIADEAGQDWVKDSRSAPTLSNRLKNPWRS